MPIYFRIHFVLRSKMNPQGLFHRFDINTDLSDNARTSLSESDDESENMKGLAEQIAAISLEKKPNPPPPSPPLSPPSTPEVFSIKNEFAKMVETFQDRWIMPDLVAEIIVKNNLNIMIIDLYDFAKGFAISFLKFGEDEEIFHGEYSYGVGLLDYIKDGEIPYEVLDNLRNYNFNILYDGYVMCQLRSHFKDEDNFSSHFVFLKQSIQTIDGECAMRCKYDGNLDVDEVRADLIAQYSPGISLDPDATSSPSFGLNNWRQHPFMTPYLKHIICNEKTEYEERMAQKKKKRRKNLYDECEQEMLEELRKDCKHNVVDFDFEDWDVTSSILEDEELSAEFAPSLDKVTNYKSSMSTYLNSRKMCFPGREHFTDKRRLHKNVEIENFVFEYAICTEAGNTESIRKKLRISVVDPREYYYYYMQGNDENEELSVNWLPVGRREPLDMYIMVVTEEFVNVKQRSGELIITHNRFFDEQVRVINGSVEIIAKKLELPASEVIARIPSL